ncbi:MAG: hypothetical protein HUU20_00795 [Pirellulales bacterium]|nr:hypothetical protein [Pirellulales bacterium]
MRKLFVGLTWLVVLLGTRFAEAEVHLFDMGTEKSELRPGFTRVTAKSRYTPETGFGWHQTDGLKEHHRFYSREWEMNESRGSKQPPPIYTNEITCDSVLSKQPATFVVDVEPGRYTVYLLSGLSAGSPRDYHWFDVAAGTAKATVKIPGPFIFERRILQTAVDGKRLAIELAPKTGWMLAALLVFPSDEEAKVRKEVLDALEKEIYFLPPDVAAEWKETRHEDNRALPEFSETDRRRGFALFARHWSEVVYPNTVPRRIELDPKLEIFASLGEYEPAAFTVHPLKDLSGLTVTAGDLRSDKGAIPADRIDVRHVRYMLVRPNYSMFFSCHIAPDVLEHRESLDAKKAENQRFWITVAVPETAEPGVYQGVLKVAASGGAAADVPLKLRVLPIRLQKNPEHIYGMYYRDPINSVSDSNTPEANAYFQRKAELERRDMVAHGMNCHISGVSGLNRDDHGNWTMDGQETDRHIALDRKFGLADRPLVVQFPVSWWYAKLVDPKGAGSHLRLVRSDVPQSFFDEVTKMVQVIEQTRKKYGWPEFLYYPIDEPSTNADSVRFMTNVLKACKQAPGVRTYVTADPTHEQFEPMWPYVDVWCCQPFVFDHAKIQQLSKEKNIEFWCYPNHISGENDHTPVRGARMTWGFGFWRSGFKALIPWIYASDVSDPWNYLDGTAMDFVNRSTPDGEPVPVTLWEAYREGIDDGRYLYTLAQLCERGKSQGGRAAELAESARKELAWLWDSIKVQEKYKYDDLWSGADFDAYRWLLASKILELQEVVK